MIEISPKMNPKEFDRIGHEVRHGSANDAEAEHRCSLYIHAFKDSLEREFTRIAAEIKNYVSQKESLHSHLYDRAIAVNDADILASREKDNDAHCICHPCRPALDCREHRDL